MKNNEDIKLIVKDAYGKIVKGVSSCCGSLSCCSGGGDLAEMSKKIGYNDEDLKAVPEGSNLGLGCGNPLALASLKEGEVVLDLGSGAGFDCFLAAKRVGKKGKVIGVDMTPEMIQRARENATLGSYENVEFRLGEIENLPVADNYVDVVISNCVINLSVDKSRVFSEAFRVLKPGGRLTISDIVVLREIPDSIKNSIEAYISCVSGAMLKDEYIALIKEAGFEEVRVIAETHFPVDCLCSDQLTKRVTQDLKFSGEDLKSIADAIVSITITGVKPIGPQKERFKFNSKR